MPALAEEPSPKPDPIKEELIQKAENLFYDYGIPDRLIKTAGILDQIRTLYPQDPYSYWAKARSIFFTKESYYVSTEKFSSDELIKIKLALADRCHHEADACIKLSSSTPECHLMKGSCYAMQGSTWGVGFKSLRICRPIDLEWEKAMNLPSTFKHQGGAKTRHYAQILRAILYRVMPNTWWFRFLGGIRGDKERAYNWMNEAITGPPLSLEPLLVMEKAATTMCYGQTENKKNIVEKGIKLLEAGLMLPTRYSMDDLDKKNMKFLLDHPKEACNYRRERFEDLSEDAFSRSINADKHH